MISTTERWIAVHGDVVVVVVAAAAHVAVVVVVASDGGLVARVRLKDCDGIHSFAVASADSDVSSSMIYSWW